MNCSSEYRAAVVMCAITSRTRQPAHSDGVSHCASVAALLAPALRAAVAETGEPGGA